MKTRGWILASAAALTAAGFVQAQDPQQRIAQLEATVARLEAAQIENARELAGTIDAVLRDAERRSQLLAAGEVSAGYDPQTGAYIKKGDEFSFKPSVFWQLRNVTSFREDADGGSDDMTNGWEVRRLKFGLEGNAFGKDLEYAFIWNTQTSGGSMFLEDAFIKYQFAKDMYVRAGQFKDPFSHEWLMHDGREMAAERSLVDAVLGGGNVGRTQGVMFIYGGYGKDQPLYIEAGLHDGANQLNTDYRPVAWDFGLAARAEYKVMGDWKDYRDFTAKGCKDRLLVLGAGIDWSQNGDGDQITGVIDMQYDAPEGIGCYVAGLVRNRDGDLSAPTDCTDWGGIVQLSYLIDGKQLEVFGLWSFVAFEDDVAAAGGEDFFNQFTVGLNYYLGKDGSAGHRAKVTIDLSWLPEGSPAAKMGQDIQGGTNGEDEIVIRGQFQLWI